MYIARGSIVLLHSHEIGFLGLAKTLEPTELRLSYSISSNLLFGHHLLSVKIVDSYKSTCARLGAPDPAGQR